MARARKTKSSSKISGTSRKIVKVAAGKAGGVRQAAAKRTGTVKGEMRALGTQAKNLTAKTAAVPATVGQSAGRALKTAVNAGSEMVATSAQLGKDAANVAVGAAQDVAQGAVDLVSEAAHVAGEAVEAGKSNLAKQIKKNPVAAAVTALGVGFIAGVSGRK